MKKKICLLTATLSFFCLTSLQAQNQPDSFIFGGFSMNQYLGDLQSPYAKYTGAFSLGVQLNRNKRLNGSIELSYGHITGQNSDYAFAGDEQASPNRFFSSTIFSAHYNLHLNILKRERFTLYLSQGLGLLRYMPADDLGRPLQDRYQTRAANENYGNSSIMLPTNAGMIYLLPNQWGLGLQAGYLNPLTDYLDNIGEWGNKSGNDNILRLRFAVYVPLAIKQP